MGANASAVAIAPAVAERPTAGQEPIIDAGVVSMARDGYFCVPLTRIGLEPSTQVTAVNSSCDCVAPRIVQYRTANRAMATAVLLEYVPEAAADLPAEQAEPVNLRAGIELVLPNGKTHRFHVDLLHTLWRQEGGP